MWSGLQANNFPEPPVVSHWIFIAYCIKVPTKGTTHASVTHLCKPQMTQPGIVMPNFLGVRSTTSLWRYLARNWHSEMERQRDWETSEGEVTSLQERIKARVASSRLLCALQKPKYPSPKVSLAWTLANGCICPCCRWCALLLKEHALHLQFQIRSAWMLHNTALTCWDPK